jgi:FkbM family methyltransferase
MLPLSGGLFHFIYLLAQRKIQPSRMLSIKYMGMDVNFRSGDCEAIEEVLHHEEYAFVAQKLRCLQTPVVLDVGSCIGTFGLWVLGINPQAQILSVEANPETFKVGQSNIPSWARDWKMENLAAFGRDGVTVSLQTAGPPMSHHLSSEGSVNVISVSLSSLLKMSGANGSIDLMKVDIEGSEEEFLCSASEALKAVKCLIVELHPGRCDVDRVVETLAREFAQIETINRDWSSKPLLYCQRQINSNYQQKTPIEVQLHSG